MGNSTTEERGPARPSRARRLAAAGALAAAVAIGAACAAKQTGPWLLHPVPPVLAGYSLSQGAIVFTGTDFSVSARPWDFRLVAEEFRGSGEPCPFGEDDAAVGRFLFFRVRLENRSARTLVFNPMRASLRRRAEVPEAALENSDLFAFAGEDLAGAETRARAFRRVSFDLAVTLRPGQTIERYLVFRSPEDGATPLTLAIEDLWLDAKSYDLHFVFEPFPGK